MAKLKLVVTIILSVVGGYFLLLVMVAAIGGLSGFYTMDTSPDNAVDSVVQNTVEEETTTKPQETTELVSESEEETSSVEESSTEPQESSVKEEPSEKETSKEETKPGFTYKGSDGTVFNSVEEIQEWIIDNDRSISSLEEVYAMSEQELIDKFEERLRIWADEEYNDFGDEGFWDNPEDFITDYPVSIKSVNDFKNWFREGKEGDILEVSYLEIRVMQVFDDRIVVRIFNDGAYDFDVADFYLDLNEDSPRILQQDSMRYLKMEYSGIRSDLNGFPLFYCKDIELK